MKGSGLRAFHAAVLAAAGVGCVPSATAGEAPRTVLVELYTSQGCSSCPAADAFVAALPSLGLPRERVVPLTFHVDYWNGLGWRDPFSSPEFTARQQSYADSGALRSPTGKAGLTGLYTPQMIVDGTTHFPGSRREIALAEIRRAGATPPALDLTASAATNGDRAVVTLRTTARPAASADEWQARVALAARATRTEVERGENGGRTLEEAAVVRVLSPPSPVQPGGAPLTITVTKPRDLRWSDVELVAFVQSPRTLRVAAAAKVPISP
jgi:hypothetical protein